MFRRIILGTAIVLLAAFAPGATGANAEVGGSELATSVVWDWIASPRERDSEVAIAASLTTTETRELLDATRISIDWDKREVYPGRDIAVRLTITSSAKVTSTDPLFIVVQLQLHDVDASASSSGYISVPIKSQPVTELLTNGIAYTSTFRAPAEGSYRLVVSLTVTPADPKLAPKLEERTFIVRSALPPGLAQLFSGLALFAAVMAIMAAGTEVIIESIKLAVGLKQKPTAMEAFLQLKAELPGQLANLGVTATWRKDPKELKDYVTHESGKLRAVLSLRKSDRSFVDGVTSNCLRPVKDLFDKLKRADAKETQELKRTANSGLAALKSLIDSRLQVNHAELPSFFKKLEASINRLTKESAFETEKEEIGHDFRRIQDMVPAWLSEWLIGQIDKYHSDPEGSSVVTTHIDNGIVPFLEELGFEKETSKRAGNELKRQINGVWRLAQDNVTLFVSATQELLKEVNNTREKVQSPLRKLGKWMGESTWKQIAGLAGAVSVIGATWVFVSQGDSSKDPMNCLVVGIACFGIFSFSVFMEIRAKYYEDRKDAKTGETSLEAWLKKQCGDFRNCVHQIRTLHWSNVIAPPAALLAVVFAFVVVLHLMSMKHVLTSAASWSVAAGTVLWSVARLLSRGNPTTVSDVETTTLAATLLQQEEKHQDEETSRVRIMRVISIIVGCILAYAVEIDAIEILGQALPGIQVSNPILGSVNQRFLGLVPLQHNLTAGMLLSGLAASAGSKFWRDFLGRLEAGKQQAEEAAIAIRRAKRALGQDEPQ